MANVTLWEHVNFEGRRLDIIGAGRVSDIRNIGHNKGNRKGVIEGGGRWEEYGPGNGVPMGWWNDVVSSISVEPGWKLTVYVHIDYGGESMVLLGSHNAFYPPFQDGISSFILEPA